MHALYFDTTPALSDSSISLIHVVGGIFSIVPLRALVVAIIAGHRYLDRTSGRTKAPRPQQPNTARRMVR